MGNKIVVNSRGAERVVYPDRRTPPPPARPEILTYKEALEWNIHSQEVRERMGLPLVNFAETRFDPVHSNKVLVVNIGDLHWGHQSVDYQFLDRNLSIIENTPNIAGMLTWNILDASIPSMFPDGVMWSSQTAQEQVYTFRDKLRKLYEKGKLICAIGSCSCHEGWMKKKAGWLIYKELFEGIDVPLLNNGGLADVQVGEQTYRFGLAHKLRYWSTLNETHGGQRLIDRIADCDIALTSHMHRGAVSQHSRYNPPFRKQIGVIASGTCKLKDEWLRDRTGEQGKPGFQGVMLWADEHRFQVVYDLDIGEELMLDAIQDEDQRQLQQVRKELALYQEKKP